MPQSPRRGYVAGAALVFNLLRSGAAFFVASAAREPFRRYCSEPRAVDMTDAGIASPRRAVATRVAAGSS